MKYLSLFLLIFIFSCKTAKKTTTSKKSNLVNEAKKIDLVLNNWHKNIANANFNASFKAMAEDAVFIGTDASEYWTKKQFMAFSKPYFDKQKTWNFKPLARNVYLNDNKDVAWFDELLDTWMNVCRGSGVMVKQNNNWLIKQYVLSVTIPNDSMNTVVLLKHKSDSVFVQKKVLIKLD